MTQLSGGQQVETDGGWSLREIDSIPKEWRCEPLQSVLGHTIGGIWGRNPGDDDVDVHVFRATELRNSGVLHPESAAVRSVSSRQLSSRLLNAGDLLLEKSGGGPTQPVGRVVRVRKHVGPAVSSNFIQLLRPDPEKVDFSFLFWQLWHWHRSGRTVALQTSSTNIRNLRTKDYLAELVILPPLDEQRQIVAAIEEQFSRLDAAAASIGRAGRNLDRHRQATLLSAVDGSWETRLLGDVMVSLKNGVFVSRPAQQPPGTPIFRISAVRPMALDVDDVRFAPEDTDPAGAYVVHEGDLLFTRYSGNASYVGACARVPKLARDTLHPDKLIRGVVDRSVADSAYLELVLSVGPSQLEIASRRKTTAGQVGIAGGQLKTVPVALPPLETQRKIVEELSGPRSLWSALSRDLRTVPAKVGQLRSAILREAFAGQLVPTAPRSSVTVKVKI